MGIVTNLDGVFHSIAPSEKNKDFITFRATVAECYKGNILKAEVLDKPNITSVINISRSPKLLESINNLNPQSPCRMQLDVDVDQPNGQYKAKVKFNLLAVVPLTPPPAAK